MLDNLKFIFQNVRSLKMVTQSRNELWNLRHTLESENANVFSFVETWLNDKILDSELEVDGYHMFRKDRGSRGEGILVYIRKSFRCSRRLDLESTNFL